MKQLYTVLFICLLLMGGGCAHKAEVAVPTPMAPPSTTIATGPGETQTAQNPPAPVVASDDEALDDDLEDLEDEFDDAAVDIADPLVSFNRAMFKLNDKLYFWVLKPVSQGYKAVIPQPARKGVRNFFRNLAFPVRFVNCMLQGKDTEAGQEFSRFFVNSTVGILGIFDISATQFDFEPSNEEFGQTLGSYGVGHGFYLVLPFLGPSSLRDTFGLVGNRLLTPTTYLSPIEASFGAEGLNVINDFSFKIGDYESFKKAAIDPYESMRSFYAQQRKVDLEK